MLLVGNHRRWFWHSEITLMLRHLHFLCTEKNSMPTVTMCVLKAGPAILTGTLQAASQCPESGKLLAFFTYMYKGLWQPHGCCLVLFPLLNKLVHDNRKYVIKCRSGINELSSPECRRPSWCKKTGRDYVPATLREMPSTLCVYRLVCWYIETSHYRVLNKHRRAERLRTTDPQVVPDTWRKQRATVA